MNTLSLPTIQLNYIPGLANTVGEISKNILNVIEFKQHVTGSCM